MRGGGYPRRSEVKVKNKKSLKIIDVFVKSLNLQKNITRFIEKERRMAKSTKRRFLFLINFLICFSLLCCIIACGSSGGRSSDDDATNGTGVTINSFTASPTSLAQGQTSVLTVKVTSSTGAAVSGETVNFSFITNNSGGTLVEQNGGITDGSGKAVAVYTAGPTTPALSLEDTIQASCGSATEVLIITRTATSATLPQLAMSASITSLKAGESSIVTATVTNSSGSPVAGQAVTFTKLIDNSTMDLITLGTGITDASGRAIAVYTAGNNIENDDVQDTVEAEISGGASYGVVIINRLGEESSTTTNGYILNVTADVNSLKAGESSIITAKVTNSQGTSVQGLIVTFTELIDNSGGTIQTLNSGRTDASGKAVAVYTAGSGSTGSVQDTIQARVNDGTYSATGVVMMTRLAEATTPIGIKMVVNAAPTSLKANQSSIITATVTDAEGNPMEGKTVTFTSLINQSGIVSLTTLGTTDASGKAVAIYTAGNNSPTTDVQDTIQARITSGSYTTYGAVIITRTGTTATTVPQGYKSTLSASITALAAGGHSVLTASITDGSDHPVSGLTVNFAIPTNNSGATLSAGSATTDAAGRAVVYYTAGNTSSTSNVQDAISATVSSGGYNSTSAVVITRTAAGSVNTGLVITVSPTPVSLASGALSVVIAVVNDANGNPVQGETVTFALAVDNSGATLSPLTATTDTTGKAFSIYTAGNNSPALEINDAVSASVTGASNAAIINRLPAAGTGNRIISFTQTPQTCNDGTCPEGRIKPPDQYVQMKVKVTTDDLSTPVKNKDVLFSIIVGGGTIFDTSYNSSTEGDPPLTALTDDNGEAWVTFQRPDISIGDTVVRAQIEDTTNGGDAASIVYWSGVLPHLTLEADPSSIIEGGSSTIKATLTWVAGNGVSGAIVGETVDFTLDSGSGGYLSALSCTTDGSGQCVITLRAGTTVPTTDAINASATYNGLSATNAVNVSITAAP